MKGTQQTKTQENSQKTHKIRMPLFICKLENECIVDSGVIDVFITNRVYWTK